MICTWYINAVDNDIYISSLLWDIHHVTYPFLLTSFLACASDAAQSCIIDMYQLFALCLTIYIDLYLSIKNKLWSITTDCLTYPLLGSFWDYNQCFDAKLTCTIRDSKDCIHARSTYELCVGSSCLDGAITKVANASINPYHHYVSQCIKGHFAMSPRYCIVFPYLIFTDPDGCMFSIL